MQKKTILHFIQDLGRGGAETMLVTVVKELKEYNNIVLTLYDNNHFSKSEFICDKYISLNLKSLVGIAGAVFKLRKIVKENKVDIVHSHLFWPTVVSRIALSKHIPLITTIHAFIASSPDYKNWYVRWADKISYRLKKTTIIAVAKGAMEEYFSILKLKPYKKYVLHTYVDTAVFNLPLKVKNENNSSMKIVTVGRITQQKNHHYLVETFKLLPHDKFELHLYGINSIGKSFEDHVAKSKCNIILKGEVNNINEILPLYDLFVMSSFYEGFSLAVLEAMAMEIPLLLSDIQSFKEQCEDTAEYFDLDNPQDFADKLILLSANKEKLRELAVKAKQRVLANFTLVHQMQGLRKIYEETLSG